MSKQGWLGALAGLGSATQQLGATAYADGLQRRRADLAARLQAERDNVQYGRQLARDETLHQRDLAKEGRLTQAQIDQEGRAEAALVKREGRALSNARQALRDRLQIEGEHSDAWVDENNEMHGPGLRNIRTGDFKQTGQKGGAGSGTGGGKAFDDYLKDFTGRVDKDWDRRIQAGEAPDPETRNGILATGQQVAQFLHTQGLSLPPATLAADVIAAAQNSGQFPNLDYRAATATAQQEMAKPGEGGWISEGKPELPDPSDKKVQARAYQLQEQAREQFTRFIVGKYFAGEEHQQAVDKAATPDAVDQPPVDLVGMLGQVDPGRTQRTAGEKVNAKLREWDTHDLKLISDWSRKAADSLDDGVLALTPLSVLKVPGIAYRFVSDVLSPSADTKLPDFYTRVQKDPKAASFEDILETRKWMSANPDRFGELSAEQKLMLLQSIDAILKAKAPSTVRPTK